MLEKLISSSHTYRLDEIKSIVVMTRLTVFSWQVRPCLLSMWRRGSIECGQSWSLHELQPTRLQKGWSRLSLSLYLSNSPILSLALFSLTFSLSYPLSISSLLLYSYVSLSLSIFFLSSSVPLFPSTLYLFLYFSLVFFYNMFKITSSNVHCSFFYLYGIGLQ